MPKEARVFIGKLKTLRETLNALKDENSSECTRFSEDVKFWAEFQTGIKVFDPWMQWAESRKEIGLTKPSTLVEACQILGDAKNFQEDCESKILILDGASNSAQKMTAHEEADLKVVAYRKRWEVVHASSLDWVARMTTLVECWNKLDGNVGELSSWVASPDDIETAASNISIERLEMQLNTLKSMFAEKQKLVMDLEHLGGIDNTVEIRGDKSAKTENLEHTEEEVKSLHEEDQKPTE